MKKHFPLSLPMAAAVLAVAGHAGTIDNSAFKAVTDGAVITAGTLDWGYLSVNSSSVNGTAGFFDKEGGGAAYSNTPFGSVYKPVPPGGTTVISTVSGSSSIGAVTLTEGNGIDDAINGQNNVSNFTFDGNTVYGSYGGLAGSEANVWTMTFNDLGVGTFNITLYMGHSTDNRSFRIDATLTDGLTNPTAQTNSGAISELGSTVAAYGTSGKAFTYHITVTTTAATDDLSLTFSSLSGSAGGAILGGYTVSGDTPPAAPNPKITSFSVSGDTATITMIGDDSVGYWCASSTDLSGWNTEETALQTGTATPIATNPDGSFNTSGGTLTFDVDVTGDSKLFLRIQDTDPSP